MSFSALQHIRSKRPSFHSSLRRACEGRCPALQTSRAQGLATLSAVSASTTLGIYFSPQRSWASLYRALFLFRDRTILSNRPSTPALSRKTLLAFRRRSSGFISRMKRCPFYAPGLFIRVGVRCSPELSGLLGVPIFQPTQKASLFPRAPHVLR